VSGGTATTLVKYYENFPKSAGSSYRREAARYCVSSVVTGDEMRLVGFRLVSTSSGGNMNTDYSVH